MRTGPGLTYDIVTTVPAGTQATIVGIDPDNDWYQVEIDGIEEQVWIYQGLTTLVKVPWLASNSIPRWR